MDGKPRGIFPAICTMSTASTPGHDFQDYLRSIEAILARRPANKVIVREVSRATKTLCSSDRWLDPHYRVCEGDGYARHLLHRDPGNRFIVLSLVWNPGQMTPIHDHSCWGIMGILHNSLEEVCYDRLDDGSRPGFAEIEQTRGADVGRGSVSYLLPPYEEIHRIGNTSDEQTISIHVYGRDLDEVNVFDQTTGKVSSMRIKYYSPDYGEEPFVI